MTKEHPGLDFTRARHCGASLLTRALNEIERARAGRRSAAGRVATNGGRNTTFGDFVRHTEAELQAEYERIRAACQGRSCAQGLAIKVRRNWAKLLRGTGLPRCFPRS